METNYVNPDGLMHFIPAYLNDDFFGCILGGDKSLGHQVIYYVQENQWYFYDYAVDAYCPTSEEKLKLLLSNYLIRCAQESGALTEIANLVVNFRQNDVLNKVIKKARAMHEADRTFFQHHKRMIDGKMIDPSQPPAHETFIKHSIIQAPAGTITLTDCYHKFYRYCKESGVNPPHVPNLLPWSLNPFVRPSILDCAMMFQPRTESR